MNKHDQIRQNIRDFREDKNLTQAQMAELIPMSLPGYAKLERGENKISLSRLQRIAEVLEVDIIDLMSEDTEGVVVINNSSDVMNNSPFSIAVGDTALEGEIKHLNYIILAKNELLDAREREIESLKNQIAALQKVITALEKN